MTDTLRDRQGNPIGGMVFNLAFSPLAEAVRQFQAVQHTDGSITLKVVPDREGGVLPPAARSHVEQSCARYLPGIPIAFEVVADIPPTRSGKRRVVVVEAAAGPATGMDGAGLTTGVDGAGGASPGGAPS